MLTQDDELLDMIARLARIAYAERQLDLCNRSLQALQERDGSDGDADHPAPDLSRVDCLHEIARWQQYLVSLDAPSG